MEFFAIIESTALFSSNTKPNETLYHYRLLLFASFPLQCGLRHIGKWTQAF
jgi:hypothetical protein